MHGGAEVSCMGRESSLTVTRPTTAATGEVNQQQQQQQWQQQRQRQQWPCCLSGVCRRSITRRASVFRGCSERAAVPAGCIDRGVATRPFHRRAGHGTRMEGGSTGTPSGGPYRAVHARRVTRRLTPRTQTHTSRHPSEIVPTREKSSPPPCVLSAKPVRPYTRRRTDLISYRGHSADPSPRPRIYAKLVNYFFFFPASQPTAAYICVCVCVPIYIPV